MMEAMTAGRRATTGREPGATPSDSETRSRAGLSRLPIDLRPLGMPRLKRSLGGSDGFFDVVLGVGGAQERRFVLRRRQVDAVVRALHGRSWPKASVSDFEAEFQSVTGPRVKNQVNIEPTRLLDRVTPASWAAAPTPSTNCALNFSRRG